MWLGIPPEEQPPHHYRLLGIGLFESDPDVIQEAADRQMAHVQTHKLGRYGPVSQKLLNELATAKVCLLNPQRKAAYDAALQVRLAPAAPVTPAPEASPLSAASSGLDFVAKDRYRAPRKKRKVSSPLIPLVLFLVLCGATGGLLYKMTQSGQLTGWLRQPPQAAPLPPEPGPEPPAAPPKQPEKVVVPSVAQAIGAVTVLDDGGLGFEQSGSQWKLEHSQFAHNADAHWAPAGRGENTAAWSVMGLAPHKEYEVFVSWPVLPDLATDAPFLVSDGQGAYPKVRVNQQLSPADVQAHGSGWKKLGRYVPRDGKLTVALSNAADGRVVADAVRIVDASAVRTPKEVPQNGLAIDQPSQRIIDNDESAFLVAGDGWETDDIGHGGSQRAHAAGGGANAAIWTIEGLDPAKHYALQATWAADREGARNAPYILLDGANQIAAFRVNQQAPPGDAVDSATLWKNLGTFACSSGKFEVRLTDEADGRVTADAIRVVESRAPSSARPPAISAMFPPPPAGRIPPPDVETERAALRKVKETFKDDYKVARKPAEKIPLAERLLSAVPGAPDAERWVLLEQARDAAGQAGNLPLVVQTGEQQGSYFAIGLYESIAQGIEKLKRESLSPAARKELARGIVVQADRAIAADAFDPARRMLVQAQTAARGTDPQLVREIAARLALISAGDDQYRAAKSAAALIDSGGDSPPLRLAIGMYLCFVKHDFARGAVLLAGGSDAALARAAQREIAYPRSAEDQVALGDLWRDAAQSVTGPNKTSAFGRAHFWYEAAHPQLTGLRQAEVAKRLDEIRALSPSAAAAPKPNQVADTPETPDEPIPDKPTQTKPVPARDKPARAAPRSVAARIKTALKENSAIKTAVQGSNSDSRARTTEETAPNGGVLIGFNYTLYPHLRVASLQAIYRSAKGTSTGAVWGEPTGAGGTVVAKKGYAVSGMKFDNSYNISCFELVFTRIGRLGLKPEDTYTSSRIGVSNDNDAENNLSSEGQPIIGIIVRARTQLRGIGFVHLPPEESPAP